MTPRRAPRAAASLGLLVLALVAATAAPALAAERPQPRWESFLPHDRWTPPLPRVSPEFVTTYDDFGFGVRATAIIPNESLPITLDVEQSVVDEYGVDAVKGALEQWNGTPGSRFAIRFGGVVADGAEPDAQGPYRGRVFFGSNRCSGGAFFGVAHTGTSGEEPRYGVGASWVQGADIELCSGSPAAKLNLLVGHELQHIAGVEHICDPGDGCWEEAMGAGNSCRLMYPIGTDCVAITQGDRDALVHLYPKLPRLAGPTRLETAAWESFYAFPDMVAADVVVLAAGHGGSAMPVVGAALAGAYGAPFLLVNDTCTSGTVAEELTRVAADNARVLLVGGVPSSCEAELRDWGLRPTSLPHVRHVAEEIAALGTDLVFVVRGPHEDGNLPDGLTAASAAGVLGAPVLFADGDRLTDEASQFIARHPELRRAFVVGGGAAVPASVDDELRSHGLVVNRFFGLDRVGTALAVADIPGAFSSGQTEVVLVSADAWPDAVSGSALGATKGWPTLLTWPGGLDARIAELLRQRAKGGFVVGGPAVFPDWLHWEASRQIR